MKSARAALACVLHAPRDLRTETRDIPPPGSGQVRLRLLAGGICGTDRHYFADGMSGAFRLAEPLVLGHEAAAEVEEVGDGPGELRRGQKVAVNPSRACGRCRFCRADRGNLCGDVFFFGSASRRPHMQGLFSEFFLADAAQCVPLPAGADPVRASCAEPLAVAMHAAARARISGKSAAVVGCGPIGLLTVLAARMAGAARVAAFDLRESALAVARAMGADDAALPDRVSGGDLSPPEVAFECSGAAAGLRLCLRLCAKGGRVVQVGNLAPGMSPPNLPAIVSKELEVVGCFRFADEFPRAVRALVSGRADVSPMLGAVFPLADAPRVFAEFPDDAAKVHLLG